MKKQYKVLGMTCTGCKDTVEKKLNALEGLQASVNLEKGLVDISMSSHYSLEEIQEQVDPSKHYEIVELDSEKTVHKAVVEDSPSGTYICPMYCEGHDKTYPQKGSCPVCNMHLVPIESLKDKQAHNDHAPLDSLKPAADNADAYICPMYCEGHDKTYPQKGNCPVCNMHLVTVASLKDKQAHNDHAPLDSFKPATDNADAYICPMYCEGHDKTYPQKGSCPVCNMHLVTVASLKDKQAHNDHAP